MPDVTLSFSDDEFAAIQTQGLDAVSVLTALLRTQFIPLWMANTKDAVNRTILEKFNAASPTAQQAALDMLSGKG